MKIIRTFILTANTNTNMTISGYTYAYFYFKHILLDSNFAIMYMNIRQIL